MNKNFIMQSMFITPKQAVELFNLNIDQNVSMFFWGEILHEGQQCWGLFLIADEDTYPQYLTGDERAEALHNSGVDVEQLVENMYAAFELSQLMQILQNEIMNMNLTDDDTVNMSFCPRDYNYHELAEGCADFLIGLLREGQFNDDQCNGALEIYR